MGEPVPTAEQGPSGLIVARFAAKLVLRGYRDVRRNRDQQRYATAQRPRKRREHISAVQRQVATQVEGSVPERSVVHVARVHLDAGDGGAHGGGDRRDAGEGFEQHRFALATCRRRGCARE